MKQARHHPPSTLSRCPRCGSREVVPIVYGLPPYQLSEAEERGEIVLGGCEPTDADRACRSCGHRWPILLG
jgi:hypothetical protein